MEIDLLEGNNDWIYIFLDLVNINEFEQARMDPSNDLYWDIKIVGSYQIVKMLEVDCLRLITFEINK
jgi:hypothetical protein